jgi:outer membrane receptor protein involved in Fe transport
MQFSYSWFDFEVIDSGEGIEELEGLLLPNSPAHKASLQLSYNKDRWAFSVAGRWVKGFPWSAGVYNGVVDDYYTTDLSAGYKFNDTISLGLNIANVTDNIHRQTFGGDLLSRRALLNVTVYW